MFGVVLWSDPSQSRAVIWCEDHGDLAFFNGAVDSALDGADLDPGDLVQFEISDGRRMRYAYNPRVVAEDEYPTLAQSLKGAGPSAMAAPKADHDARIVPFAPHAAKAQARKKQTVASAN